MSDAVYRLERVGFSYPGLAGPVLARPRRARRPGRRDPGPRRPERRRQDDAPDAPRLPPPAGPGPAGVPGPRSLVVGRRRRPGPARRGAAHASSLPFQRDDRRQRRLRPEAQEAPRGRDGRPRRLRPLPRRARRLGTPVRFRVERRPGPARRHRPGPGPPPRGPSRRRADREPRRRPWSAHGGHPARGRPGVGNDGRLFDPRLLPGLPPRRRHPLSLGRAAGRVQPREPASAAPPRPTAGRAGSSRSRASGSSSRERPRGT